MRKPPQDPAASVHARLLAGAQGRKEDFNLTLKRYAAERFLYRLGASRHRERFVLKGAMLFALWGGSLYRATRDLDLTGYGEGGARGLIELIREICGLPCPGDGLQFLSATVRAEPIRDKSEYHGFRVKLRALLGAAKLDLQIDVGFGNAVEPPAREEKYPVLLDGPAPRIRAYPREAVVAEKLHAMVVLGTANSRLKDFYDVFALAKNFPFAGPALGRAIAATFERRSTPIQDSRPVALGPEFYLDPERAAQWRRYLSLNGLPGAPADFAAVGELLQGILGPVWSALADTRAAASAWRPGGPWGAAG